MSWADHDRANAFDGNIFDNPYKRKDSLTTGIHEGANGVEVDVRTIDAKYANNLYNWYLRNNPLNSKDALLNSNLMKILKERKGGKHK